jgi:hypothetical protein
LNGRRGKFEIPVLAPNYILNFNKNFMLKKIGALQKEEEKQRRE